MTSGTATWLQRSGPPEGEQDVCGHPRSFSILLSSPSHGAERMTTIGPSAVFSGELTTTEEDLVIEGRVEGYVYVRDATVTIEQTASIKADIRAAEVIVLGHVEGSITASQRIELAPTARVDGNLSANRVVITDGARFNGRIDMDQRTIAAKVAQYKAAQAATRS
jgi:cytoskeletal protein CcmA (bactofilin family)